MDVPKRWSAILTDRYQIEQELGAGGMATVYLARDLRHQRNVALKVLRAELCAILGPDRFLTEIQVTANLQHSHILPLFDSGEANGLLYYVMPFIEGETLRHRLERERQLPIDDAIRIASAVASALDYAHSRGVIHRDLKPENILLRDHEALVTDFGIALALNSAGGDRITQLGISLGTPEYVSPEQATGDRRIDARSDIYALGAVLYEMLVGEPPHTGNSVQAIIAKVLTERPLPVRTYRETVPEHVEVAVARALARLPADRFATAGEFAGALAGRHASAERAPTAALPSKLNLSKARQWAPWAVAAAIGAVALVQGLRTEPTSQLTRFEIVPPESMPLRDLPPLVSPDGSHIVYASRTDSALYVRGLDTPETRRIASSEGVLPECISADGAWVVFRVLAGALKKVSIEGGAPVMIADSGGRARCSDQHELVFQRQSDLWRVSMNGGLPALVARPDTTRRHRAYDVTDILPGGRAALVTVIKGGFQAELGIVWLADGSVTELGIPGTYAQYVRTGHIVFGRGDGAARSDGSIMAVPFSLRRMRVTGPIFTVNEPVARAPGWRKISPTGTMVYHASPTWPARLMLVDRRGNAAPFADRVGEFVSPRISPDGQRVAMAAR
ncbi:MAG: protein kinase domain-containing protein [Longimicrobiales bacterium]